MASCTGSAPTTRINAMTPPDQWAIASRPDSERWEGPYTTRELAASVALDNWGDPDDGFEPCVALCRPVTDADSDAAEEGWTFIVYGDHEIVTEADVK